MQIAYGGHRQMASSDYHLKQAQIALRMALVEPDVVKAARLSLLALNHFDKAESSEPRCFPSHRTSREDDQDRA